MKMGSHVGESTLVAIWPLGSVGMAPFHTAAHLGLSPDFADNFSFLLMCAPGGAGSSGGAPVTQEGHLTPV